MHDDQQRRMEPAAMLVRAFEIQVGGKLSISCARCEPRSTVWCVEPGIEPDVERVLDLLVARRRRRRAVFARRASATLRCRPARRLSRPASSSSERARMQLAGFLATKNGIGTPHCRWRDSVQSGRLAIMPCRRALPQAGKELRLLDRRAARLRAAAPTACAVDSRARRPCRRTTASSRGR